jgi:two-component system response regulator VicR
MKSRILMVEDDRALTDIYRPPLEKAGYQVECVHQGTEAMRAYYAFRPDLVILDLNLGDGVTGLDVLKSIRQESSDVRIIIVTSEVSEQLQAFGLSHGANDYAIKHLKPQLLVARVKEQLRHGLPALQYRFGSVKVDLERNLVWCGSQRNTLCATERRVLARLLETPDRAVSFASLFQAGWGVTLPQPPTAVDLAPLDAIIYRLRTKTGPDFILNARGGYMLAAAQPEAPTVDAAAAKPQSPQRPANSAGKEHSYV